MSKKRTVEKNLGLFTAPSDMDGGGFLVPMTGLNVGPGKPGPGGEWRMPEGPIEAEDEGELQRVRPQGTLALPFRRPGQDQQAG